MDVGFNFHSNASRNLSPFFFYRNIREISKKKHLRFCLKKKFISVFNYLDIQIQSKLNYLVSYTKKTNQIPSKTIVLHHLCGHNNRSEMYSRISGIVV